MKFRVDHEPAPLELDLVADHGFDDADVSFERVRPPWSRPKRLLAGGAVAVVLAGGAVALADDEPITEAPTLTAPAATSVPAAPTTRSVAPATSEAVARTTAATSTGWFPPAAFSEDPGWRVYLTDGFELQVFDPWSGAVTELPGRSDVYAVVAGPRNAVILQYGTLDAQTILVGDGTTWAMVGETVVRRSLADRSVLERVDLPPGWVPTPIGASLIGADAFGRPVVVAADQRAYSVAADGSLERLTEGAIFGWVQQGQFVEVTCNDAARCTVTARGTAGDLPIETNGQLAPSFSPLGTHLAVHEWFERFTVRIFDLELGEVVRIDVAQPPYQTGLTPSSGWSPDGRFYFFTTDGVLQMFDTATNELTELATNLRPDVGVVGVAVP